MVGESNSIVCPRCGRAVEVGSGASPVVFCPSCMTRIATSVGPRSAGSRLAVAASPSQSSGAAGAETSAATATAVPAEGPERAQNGREHVPPSAHPIQLRKDLRGAGYARVCPACQFELEPGDVVCPRCGYHTATGESMAERARRRERLERWVRGVWVLAVLIGVGWLVWRAAGPSSWAWWRSTLSRDLESTTEEAPPTGTLPPPSEEQIAAVRQEVTQQIATIYPRAEDGEEVTVALRTGRVLRGRVYRTDHGLRIESRDGRVEEPAWAELDEASRLRCDDRYRAARIEAEVRRKLGL